MSIENQTFNHDKTNAAGLDGAKLVGPDFAYPGQDTSETEHSFAVEDSMPDQNETTELPEQQEKMKRMATFYQSLRNRLNDRIELSRVPGVAKLAGGGAIAGAFGKVIQLDFMNGYDTAYTPADLLFRTMGLMGAMVLLMDGSKDLLQKKPEGSSETNAENSDAAETSHVEAQ